MAQSPRQGCHGAGSVPVQMWQPQAQQRGLSCQRVKSAGPAGQPQLHGCPRLSPRRLPSGAKRKAKARSAAQRSGAAAAWRTMPPDVGAAASEKVKSAASSSLRAALPMNAPEASLARAIRRFGARQ